MKKKIPESFSRDTFDHLTERGVRRFYHFDAKIYNAIVHSALLGFYRKNLAQKVRHEKPFPMTICTYMLWAMWEYSCSLYARIVISEAIDTVGRPFKRRRRRVKKNQQHRTFTHFASAVKCIRIVSFGRFNCTMPTICRKRRRIFIAVGCLSNRIGWYMDVRLLGGSKKRVGNHIKQLIILLLIIRFIGDLQSSSLPFRSGDL